MDDERAIRIHQIGESGATVRLIAFVISIVRASALHTGLLLFPMGFRCGFFEELFDAVGDHLRAGPSPLAGQFVEALGPLARDLAVDGHHLFARSRSNRVGHAQLLSAYGSLSRTRASIMGANGSLWEQQMLLSALFFG